MIVRSFRVVMTKEAIITPSFKKKKNTSSYDLAVMRTNTQKKI